jgi:uncharacterized protein YegP (UPF0339 family)
VTTILRTLLLVAAMSGLVVAGGLSNAPAMQKDKDKGKVGTVEVYKDKAGEFRFRVKDLDGKVIAMTTRGYATKAECLKTLDLVKSTLNNAKVMEVKDDDKK